MADLRKRDESYSDEETQRRFEAALRGARAVGHEPMKAISPKRKIAAHKLLKKPKAKKAAK